jgi:phosphoribosyl-ATP pyrophosphohydrolase
MTTHSSNPENSESVLTRLTAVIESRLPTKGIARSIQKSYVASLLEKGPDAFLKKIGEEATEVVMAAKDFEPGDDSTRKKIVAEMADLWFHCMIALAYYGLSKDAVLAELARREGLSGIDEKALRKLHEIERERGG